MCVVLWVFCLCPRKCNSAEGTMHLRKALLVEAARGGQECPRQKHRGSQAIVLKRNAQGFLKKNA